LRKPFRLSAEVYRSGHCFSVTIVTSDRRPIFRDQSRAARAIDCLRESSERFSAEIYAFCFMPDHVHVLGKTPEGVRFDEFVRHFKQLTGFRLSRDPGTVRVWQPSYFDHALRREEELEATARYILRTRSEPNSSRTQLTTCLAARSFGIWRRTNLKVLGYEARASMSEHFRKGTPNES
jgi:putative transposase